MCCVVKWCCVYKYLRISRLSHRIMYPVSWTLRARVIIDIWKATRYQDHVSSWQVVTQLVN
jgi:hypothetical protein